MNTERILGSAGLRNTRQRRMILELLFAQGSPLSHGEILSRIDEHLDRVTLYRTLETLKKAGIVHQVQGIDGVWRFCAHDEDSSGCPGDHPHFLCLDCGRMFCITDQRMPRVTVPEGIEVEGKQFVVYGRCAECATQISEKRDVSE
ncbi:MAG: Fur family transcriptional regulator [Synergistaceae bacterium]|nr:Fur family transcriptional regulator [Synergistaceae bacterium]